jgi:FAD/FMN-containing dehydrogenase
VTADGSVLSVSRSENAELFRLAIGGYGLFGVIAAVTLRLAPRRKLERVVDVISAEQLLPAVDRRIADGFLYGDFQYATDPEGGDFLRRGVFSCYRPVDDGVPMPERQKELSADGWDRLLYLAHTDKARAFAEYAGYYLSTSGQLYWSDTHQLSYYRDDYHTALDRRLGAPTRATEMISEIYVPRRALATFLAEVADDFQRTHVDVVYGTVRLIERDAESFLAWAREAWACAIFNLHVVHTPEGLAHAQAAFRRLIDHGLRHGGTYYLTYHRWATRRQVEAAYPQLADFLRLKRRYDPEERFQSDWYRHYRTMFADRL